MNRLSFLKKLGVGIAVAAITPKVLANIPEKKVECDVTKPTYYDDLKSKYGHFEEPWIHSNDVNSLHLHDMCIDRDARPWICTGIFKNEIELRAMEPEPLPNLIDIKRNSFNEYFIIINNSFSEGSGEPKSYRNRSFIISSKDQK